MRKVIFLMAAFCLNCGVVKSQVSDAVIATLQHGDSLQTFYGYYALSDAYYAAADSGDVIRLSAGTFYSPIMTHPITIIGAGFESDSIRNIYATIIDKEGFSYYRGIGYYSIEGIKFLDIVILGPNDPIDNKSNVSFTKCYFDEGFTIYSDTENLTIRQCVINDSNNEGFDLSSTTHTNFCIEGSYFNSNDRNDLSQESTIYINHCVVASPFHAGATYTNCIIGGSFYDKTTNVVRNCVLFDEEPEITTTGYINYYNFDYDDIFEEEMDDLWWDDEKTFKVKADLGTTDGTEIGMYGGDYPYNPTPSVPQITDITLDDSDIANGTLKVSVTAEAQTEN